MKYIDSNGKLINLQQKTLQQLLRDDEIRAKIDMEAKEQNVLMAEAQKRNRHEQREKEIMELNRDKVRGQM